MSTLLLNTLQELLIHTRKMTVRPEPYDNTIMPQWPAGGLECVYLRLPSSNASIRSRFFLTFCFIVFLLQIANSCVCLFRQYDHHVLLAFSATPNEKLGFMHELKCLWGLVFFPNGILITRVENVFFHQIAL